MAFQKKTWQFNDIITEGELNRMEEGIEEGITKAEQAGQVAQQAQQTANQAASDLAAHLNDTTKHVTQAEKDAWNSAEANAKAYADNTFARKQQEAWIAPTLLNGWVNVGPPESLAGYFKDSLGIVHLKGTIRGGTVTSNTILFVLPVGYRPLEQVEFPIASSNGTSIVSGGTLKVSPNGNVTIMNTIGNHMLWLDGITFRAEQ